MSVLKSGVYLIKNSINDFVYVGSSKYVKQRISQHKSTLKKNKNSNSKLQEFYNNNGMAVLEFVFLESCNEDKIKDREQFYLDSFQNKFNIAGFSVSTKGVACKSEIKDRISKSLLNANLKGIKKSEETKQRMRKPKTESHKQNIKKAQENSIKKVYQFDLEKNFIGDHRSVTDASKNTNISRRCISATCNNRQKSAGGFMWSFTKKELI